MDEYDEMLSEFAKRFNDDEMEEACRNHARIAMFFFDEIMKRLKRPELESEALVASMNYLHLMMHISAAARRGE